MRYDKIINLPRPLSHHPKMSVLDRAAQFSSFAALVGLDKQMDETARLVDSKFYLSEDEGESLNQKLRLLIQKVSDGDIHPAIRAICFVPDQRKDGGAYVIKSGEVKRIDDVFHKVLFTDGSEISISDVLDFEIIGYFQTIPIFVGKQKKRL